MKILAGIAIGMTVMILGRRYMGALLWWMFTQDVRGQR